MSDPLWGLLLSATLLVVVIIVLRHERATGVRSGRYVREHTDFYILKASHAVRQFFRSFGRGIVRQTAHYLLHTVLASFLQLFERGEQVVKTTMRSNRAIARRVQKERATRNKLEEIAIHKMEVALSDDEKRVRRTKMLNE
jgi:DNA integrity scanning protein DisA with diadenylate cyclase activity